MDNSNNKPFSYTPGHEKEPLNPPSYEQKQQPCQQQPMSFQQQPMSFQQQPMAFQQQPMAFQQQPMLQQQFQQQPAFVAAAGPIAVGPDSMEAMCPKCQCSVRTQIRRSPTTRTHLACLILFLCGCLCCCIPYCMNSCLNANHYCPKCGNFFGTYES